MTKKAIIVGASGLIGSELLDILSIQKEYIEVLSISRKKIKLNNAKITQLIADLDHPDTYADELHGDVIFCCIGTTRKQTPDLDLYRKIDHDYPVKLAEIAKKNNIPQFHIVSSVGANAASPTFYLKIKGEMERDLKQVGLEELVIYQPSFLVGQRKHSRKGERFVTVVLKLLSPLLIGPLKKYKSIDARTVASAMFKRSLKYKKGVFTYTTDQIKRRA